MPSASVLEHKKQIVAELKNEISESCTGILVSYEGTNVADDTALRKELREAGVEYSVVKNKLLKIAVEGTELEGLTEFLAGTTALATSKEDYVAAARILSKFAKTHSKFEIKTGYLDGEVISDAKINDLASLPSREILLATVCNVFNAPIAAFARVVQAVADKAGESAE